MGGSSAASASSAASRTCARLRLLAIRFFLIQNAFADEEQGKFGDRIAVRFGFALFGRFVELFVIGKRVRIGARAVGVNESGAAALAAIINGALDMA